jgi:hypothetical protein
MFVVNRFQLVLGGFHFFGENLNKFQASCQNENLHLSPIDFIPTMKHEHQFPLG